MEKFRFTLLALSASLSFLSVQADQPTMNDSAAEPQMQHPRPQAVNPSGRPQVKEGANLFITADYLLWQATEENLNYASNIDNFYPIGVITPEGHLFAAKFNWQSGFRLGLGYNLGHDQWDTNVAWTWFEDDASGHAKGSDELPFVFGTISTPELSVTCLRAKSHLDLHLNLLDWELGREFYSSKWLSLRPFAGVRTGWINQNWKTEYHDVLVYYGVPGQGPVKKVNVDLEQEFWGIGLRGGLDSEWGLISGLSLYANGAVSLLYGFFEDSRRESNISLTGIYGLNLDGSVSHRNEQAITELQMGLRWDQMFSNDRFHFRIQAGWEHMVFFEHNRLFYFTTSGSTATEYGGNLAFQGWSASARFDF